MSDTQTLALLIQRKRHCLEQLHALGGEQLACIERGDIDGLFAVLDARQKWLSAFERIEELLMPYRQQEPSQRHWADERLREQCRADQEACQQLLGEIAACEERCRSLLQVQCDEMAMQMRQMNGGHVAASGYLAAAAAPDTGGCLDLSAES